MVAEIEILSPNVALNGTATQSSNFHHPACFSDPDQALYANDGNFSTDVHGLRARCAITNADQGAWWQVDLMSYHSIQKVTVTTRKAAGTISGLTSKNDLNPLYQKIFSVNMKCRTFCTF